MRGLTPPPPRRRSRPRPQARPRPMPTYASSWSAKFRQSQPRTTASDLTRAQLGKKVLGSSEILHLDINRTDLADRVSVGAGASRGSQHIAQLLGAPVDFSVGTTVPDLDDVDLARQ